MSAKRVDPVPGVGAATHGRNRLGCPYCCAYEIDRMYVASIGVDACTCRACGREWDELTGSGDVLGPSQRHSVLLHH